MKNSSYFLFIVLALTVWSIPLFAQAPFFQGYEADISGTRFTYHSPLPDVSASLLSRARKSFPPIEWQTEAVPANYTGKTVTFIWVYGMDVLAESQRFDLFVDGKKWVEFFSPLDNEKTSWSVYGDEGAVLTFTRTMIDKHKDQMGFATLTLPVSAIQLGSPAVIKVDGEDQESNAWYMTFKTTLQEEVKITQNKVVARKEGALFHVARFNFTHLGEPAYAVVQVGQEKDSVWLHPGHNALDLYLPKVEEPTRFVAQLAIGNGPAAEYPFSLEPLREWTIYLVQHSHTDIGYTRPQTEILPEHLRYIDYALDYCDQTDDYPDNAKFRWTCEASWAVREYLESRPETQIDRLLKRIKEGRIEVTGMFFNFSEIADETVLAAQTRTLKTFKDRGIEVSTAMQNDVNGIGWCMVDFFSGTDVKYLNMGQHGHRAHVPFDKPTSFWWESPAGNRLLAYRSEHYMHGNALSLTSGYIDVFRSNLSNYLEDLENKGYPFDHTAFQFSGYVTDNSPPSTVACDIVKEWNETYEWPKLRIALANEFLTYLEQHEADYLPVKKVAWPDWWADGFGSAMNETKAARTTQADMVANTGLLSMATMLGAQLPQEIADDISECQDDLLFYDEHTFGAAESISDPMSENAVIQWGEKSAYVWTAVKNAALLREKAMGFMQPLVGRSDVPTIAIFNTLNWDRSGLVTVYIDHEILPTNKKFQMLDDQGRKVSAQAMSSRSDGTYWALWVPEVPAMGYKTLRIEVGEEAQKIEANMSADTNLENAFYRLTLDREKGVITSLFDKELQVELLDVQDTISLGAFIYERLDNRQAMERLTNTNRDTIYVPLKKTLSTLTDITVSAIEDGAIWKSIRIHGTLPDCADSRGVNIEIRLYHTDKRIQLLYDMHKLPVTEPEAVYVAFPFGLEGSKLAFEAQGGLVFPGINQLEGTSSDWNVVQNFASVRNDQGQIVYSSNDIPLVQFGAINTGRFYYRHQPETSHIYSWVLNNYWTTNFKASQEGEMKWDYYLTSSSDRSNTFATRFGWGSRVPLLARVIPEGETKQASAARSVLDLGVPNLLLVDAQPSLSGDAVILHVREVEGDHAILDITRLLQETGARAISEVNVLEDEIQVSTGPLLIEHFETKFIKFKY
ncbi:MAG: hypothetical protein IPL49_20405 [Saprospirales bacterium]|nr:hypothetical protein [Saprospirales bacterium]